MARNVLLVAAVGMVLAWILCGCTRTVYEPLETVRVEYREADTTAIYERARIWYESMLRREKTSDSIIDRQKETVILKENGDTARHDNERIIYVSSRREKELEHKISQCDSIIESLREQLKTIKADSIPVPYPVEKRLSRWEEVKMDFGGVAIGGVASVLVLVAAWLAWRFLLRKKQ